MCEKLFVGEEVKALGRLAGVVDPGELALGPVVLARAAHHGKAPRLGARGREARRKAVARAGRKRHVGRVRGVLAQREGAHVPPARAEKRRKAREPHAARLARGRRVGKAHAHGSRARLGLRRRKRTVVLRIDEEPDPIVRGEPHGPLRGELGPVDEALEVLAHASREPLVGADVGGLEVDHEKRAVREGAPEAAQVDRAEARKVRLRLPRGDRPESAPQAPHGRLPAGDGKEVAKGPAFSDVAEPARDAGLGIRNPLD